jgi:hypothetical protein
MESLASLISSEPGTCGLWSSEGAYDPRTFTAGESKQPRQCNLHPRLRLHLRPRPRPHLMGRSVLLSL